MDRQQNQFYGRERLIREIVSGALAPQPASYSLVGSKLAGKSSLLEYLASPDGPLLGDDSADLRPYAFQDAGRIVVTQIDCAWQEAQQDLLVFLCDRLIRQLRTVERIDLDWAAVEGQSSASRRIWQISRQLNQMGYRLILLMDNFDAVFQNQLLTPDAIDELRPLTLETALVVATEHPLHDLDRELAASPLFNVMTQLFVGLIETEAALRWVHAYCAAYPNILPACDDLLELTGCHPFLLHRLGDILAEVQTMLASRQPLGAEHLPLIRLRLAEHGRLLFATLWRRLQAPPPRIEPAAVMALLGRLLAAPLPLNEVTQEQFAPLNWLINQAMVIYGAPGYQLFSSLFAEFLRVRAGDAAATGAAGNANRGQALFFDSLTKTESALLRYFQTHKHEVVSPEQLLADVWKRPNASPRRVQEAIRRLRLRLDEASPPVGVIENERGRGYRYVPARAER
jgi:hypothetical protein